MPAPARPMRRAPGIAAPAPPAAVIVAGRRRSAGGGGLASAASSPFVASPAAAAAIVGGAPSLPSPRHAKGRLPPPSAKKGGGGGGGAAAPPSPAALLTGAIVAFPKDGSPHPQFGVVSGPDGKAKIAIVAFPRGNKVSLAPKTLTLAIPGSFKSSDLDAMLPKDDDKDDDDDGGASLLLSDEDLELGWEVALDEHGQGAGVALPELAELLLGASGPKELVRAYRLLSDPRAGGRFFAPAKAAGGAAALPSPAFSARSAEAVAAARAAAEAEAAVKREEAGFVAAMNAAMEARRAGGGGGDDQEKAGTREAWARWLRADDGGNEHAAAFAARVRALRALALWAPTGEAPQPPRGEGGGGGGGRNGNNDQTAMSAATLASLLAGPPLPPPPRGLAAPEDDLGPALPLGVSGCGDDNKALFSPALLELGRKTVALFGGGSGGGGGAAAASSSSSSSSSSSDLQALAAASNAAWRLLVDASLVRAHEPRPLLAVGVDPRRPFSPGLEAAAATLAAAALRLPDRDAERRVAFGGAVAGGDGDDNSGATSRLRVFAIDDADTLDVDDALSVELLGVEGGEGDGAAAAAAAAAAASADGAALRIWVHVADPTRWLLPAALGEDDADDRSSSSDQRLVELSRLLLSSSSSNSSDSPSPSSSSLRAAARALLSEARRRTRSLYLPFGSVPMFPDLLSAGLFSLVPSEEALRLATQAGPDAAAAVGTPDRCALSFGVTLDGSGAVVEGSVTIVPSFVRVTDRLTYDEVDAQLAVGAVGAVEGGCSSSAAAASSASSADLIQDRDAALQLLYAASRRRREWRDGQGAITIDTPECKLVVGEDELDAPSPAPTATRLSQWESAARQTVAEAMILAGAAAGAAGASAGLALPFRSQPQPTDLPSAAELDALPPGPCRGYALRRKMTRSAFSGRPAPHAALGLSEYVQVTSPIRRFSDLLAHAGLKEKAAVEVEEASFLALSLSSLFEANALTASLAEQAASADPLGRAERAVERYWSAEWARQQRAKDEPMDAFVLGWAGRGGGGGGGGGGNSGGGLAAVSLEASGLETVARVWWDARPGERVQALVEEARPGRGGFWRVGVSGGGGGEGGGLIEEEVVAVAGGSAAARERGFLDEEEDEDEDEEEEEDEDVEEEEKEEEEEEEAATA